MRFARTFAGVSFVAILTLLAADGVRSQDKEGKGSEPAKAKGRGLQLPKYWDQIELTAAQRADVLKLTADYQEKKAKLQEEIRKLDEEVAKKRVSLLTDEQRKKLIDLVAGPEPKPKADPKAKGKDK